MRRSGFIRRWGCRITLLTLLAGNWTTPRRKNTIWRLGFRGTRTGRASIANWFRHRIASISRRGGWTPKRGMTRIPWRPTCWILRCARPAAPSAAFSKTTKPKKAFRSRKCWYPSCAVWNSSPSRARLPKTPRPQKREAKKSRQ